MLIVALVMAIIGLAALVTAVVTSNEVIAWVCIAASVIGVVLLIVDALRERQRRDTGPAEERDGEADAAAGSQEFDAEYPEDAAADRPEPSAGGESERTEAVERDPGTRPTTAESVEGDTSERT